VSDFASKTILVTGASGGIGGATVRKLAARGAKVIAAGRSESDLAAITQQTGARPLAFDLASEESIAGPIAFLLSDEAAMISGVSLPIDGGYTSR
jgi:L-xylulose reductase